ncbi:MULTISPECIES: histidine--tRNA ligase [Porphyromonas]|uniref:Histidine--tRNA ligase n=1 Tax=Porphyromonas canoris TaxID=36875 RepID=A0ABR4XKV8_9PORP|nr:MULTISPECIES: histidine--tRNA ligase [Porphyromonas]KGL53866.1 histidyl-tRNA synthase [Porphyromonas canoris]KGN67388.1 histidyl-tRNA synthase [Porphyromonas sp. COT-108 OH1349]KGN92121.1 histidyl-tRNA synthase [Porphyromonas canoris]
MQKPSIPKGTRDFLPHEMERRNYIFETIKSVFHSFGFRQIETPAMENLSTLTGKYGDEGDKLLFRILNSGDCLAKFTDEELLAKNSASFAAKACDRGLRYDLTVPFARFVVQHRNEITLPFRRYQIQPVWRADRPQKGRYREFFQCDADMIGSDSLLNEVELTQIIDTVFTKLGFPVRILLNNRKILTGIAEYIGHADKIIDITVAMDKTDKIGLDKVVEELKEREISDAAIEKLMPILRLSGGNREKIAVLREVLAESSTAIRGLDEVEFILDKLALTPLKNELELNLTLARGLDYYTGAIFEVKAVGVEMGSITGGGRYDNLTGVFGLDNISGVGISFGADRIYDVLNMLDLYPKESARGTQLLFINFGEKEVDAVLPVLNMLRMQGVRTELYPDAAKMKKQMSYADDLNIPFVAFVGTKELENGVVNIKDMKSGEQKDYPMDELVKLFL